MKNLVLFVLCLLAVLFLSSSAAAQAPFAFDVDPPESEFTWRVDTPAGWSEDGHERFGGLVELELAGGGDPIGTGRFTGGGDVVLPEMHVVVLDTFPPVPVADVYVTGAVLHLTSDTFTVTRQTGAFDATLIATFGAGQLIYDEINGGVTVVELAGLRADPLDAQGTLREVPAGGYELGLGVAFYFHLSAPGFDGLLHLYGGIGADFDCPATQPYCVAAPNSVGPGALLRTFGPTSVSDNELFLAVTGLPGFATGVFFYGTEPTQVPFGEGFRCAAGVVTRLHVVVADELGHLAMHLDHAQLPPAAPITGGDTRYFQLWYRDPDGGPAGHNLTDGREVFFCL